MATGNLREDRSKLHPRERLTSLPATSTVSGNAAVASGAWTVMVRAV
ncbi:hypothetical protein RHOER0001_0235 [Rhodococcus erythropolis SK121]|nr:hypothetical protein RHOER0001_0235 [Rhodococcus erythropolis SK121]